MEMLSSFRGAKHEFCLVVRAYWSFGLNVGFWLQR